LKNLRWQAGLATLLLTLFSDNAPVTAQTRKPARVQPHLFLIYALEDLHRDLLPKDASELGDHYAYQQVRFDQLAAYLQKYRENDLNPYFSEYAEFLRDMREASKRIEAINKKHWDPVCQALWKLNYENVVGSNALALHAGLFVTDLLIRDSAFGDSISRHNFGQWMRKAIEVNVRVAEAQQKVLLACEVARKGCKEELDTVYPSMRVTLTKRKGALSPVSREVYKRLGKKYGWAVEPAAFDSNRPLRDWEDGAMPANPLEVLRIVGERPTPEGLEAADRHYRDAVDYRHAAEMMLPSNRMFDAYRSQLYYLAAVSFNRSCAVQLGTAGLKNAPVKAAGRAQQTWNAYKASQPGGFPLDDGLVPHQYILSYAYGTKTDQIRAYKMVFQVMLKLGLIPTPRGGLLRISQPVPKNRLYNPAFWYDAARVCSVVGEAKSGFLCLEKAVNCDFGGLRSFAQLQRDPDLELLRNSDPDRFKRLGSRGG
jgi:hypothetical protein